MVNFLKEKKDDSESIETTFELNDTLYAKAKLDQVDSVHLWLGVSRSAFPQCLTGVYIMLNIRGMRFFYMDKRYPPG